MSTNFLATFQFLSEYRDGGAGQGQLRRNLRPVAQSADESSAGELVRHHDLITGVQPETIKFCPGEKPIDIIGSDDDPVRAQYEGVVQVGLGFSLTGHFEIRSGGVMRVKNERSGIVNTSHH